MVESDCPLPLFPWLFPLLPEEFAVLLLSEVLLPPELLFEVLPLSTLLLPPELLFEVLLLSALLLPPELLLLFVLSALLLPPELLFEVLLLSEFDLSPEDDFFVVVSGFCGKLLKSVTVTLPSVFQATMIE